MSVLPLYHRVFLVLRDRIVSGDYDWREPMPGEMPLCRELGVSRSTLRKALELLEEDGLIRRRQGKRTYPRSFGAREPARRNLDIESDDVSYNAIFAGELSQRYERVAADRTLRKQFGAVAELGRVRRVRQAGGKPYCFVITWLPVEIADRIDWERLGSKPVITAVEQAGFSFATVEQSITAITADEAAADALAVPVGSPLLRISGVFLSASETVIMRKDGHFLPESFEYRTTLHAKQN